MYATDPGASRTQPGESRDAAPGVKVPSSGAQGAAGDRSVSPGEADLSPDVPGQRSATITGGTIPVPTTSRGASTSGSGNPKRHGEAATAGEASSRSSQRSQEDSQQSSARPLGSGRTGGCAWDVPHIGAHNQLNEKTLGVLIAHQGMLCMLDTGEYFSCVGCCCGVNELRNLKRNQSTNWRQDCVQRCIYLMPGNKLGDLVVLSGPAKPSTFGSLTTALTMEYLWMAIWLGRASQDLCLDLQREGALVRRCLQPAKFEHVHEKRFIHPPCQPFRGSLVGSHSKAVRERERERDSLRPFSQPGL